MLLRLDLPPPGDVTVEIRLAHPEQPADAVNGKLAAVDQPAYRLGRDAKPGCDGVDVQQWLGAGDRNLASRSFGAGLFSGTPQRCGQVAQGAAGHC